MKKIVLTIRIPYTMKGKKYASHKVVCKSDEERVKEVVDLLIDICSMLEFEHYSIDLLNEDLSNAQRIYSR